MYMHEQVKMLDIWHFGIHLKQHKSMQKSSHNLVSTFFPLRWQSLLGTPDCGGCDVLTFHYHQINNRYISIKSLNLKKKSKGANACIYDWWLVNVGLASLNFGYFDDWGCRMQNFLKFISYESINALQNCPVVLKRQRWRMEIEANSQRAVTHQSINNVRFD